MNKNTMDSNVDPYPPSQILKSLSCIMLDLSCNFMEIDPYVFPQKLLIGTHPENKNICI